MIDITSLVRDLGAAPLAIGIGVVALLVYSIIKGGKSGGSGSSSSGSSSSGGSTTPPPANPTGGA